MCFCLSERVLLTVANVFIHLRLHTSRLDNCVHGIQWFVRRTVVDDCTANKQVLQEHLGDQSEVDRVFGAVDMDRSGRLHYMEFLAATIEARGYIEVEHDVIFFNVA